MAVVTEQRLKGRVTWFDILGSEEWLNFADDICGYNFLKENLFILIVISQKFPGGSSWQYVVFIPRTDKALLEPMMAKFARTYNFASPQSVSKFIDRLS